MNVWLKKLKLIKEKDEKVKHERELINRADGLISQLKQISSNESLPAEQKTVFDKHIEELTNFKDAQDFERKLEPRN